MDLSIFLILLQDGIVYGAIYAMLAMAIILVFSVTRVILFFEGELIAFSALTMIAITAGRIPGMLLLLLILSAISAGNELVRHRKHLNGRVLGRLVAVDIVYPALVYVLVTTLAPQKPGLLVAGLLTLALVAPVGPAIYRVAFKPIAEAPTLTLLMVSMGVHLVVLGGGLYAFGSGGARGESLVAGNFSMFGHSVAAHSLLVVAVAMMVVAALWAFTNLTLLGKALRASAINRVGARLVGIPTALSGQIAFALAAAIGATSGILIAPMSTIYYDSGFVIGLKGFVAAIFGGLASYPLALGASVIVGTTEGFAAFWASAFKEVVVFAIVIPALFWISLGSVHMEDDE